MLGSGFQALVLTALLVGLGVCAGLPLGMLTDMLLPLAAVATLAAFLFSLLLYLKALLAPASALAPGGNSGESHPVGTDRGSEGACLQSHSPLFSRQPHLRLLLGTGAQPAHRPLGLQILLRAAARPHRLGMPAGLRDWRQQEGRVDGQFLGRAGAVLPRHHSFIPQTLEESNMCPRYWDIRKNYRK